MTKPTPPRFQVGDHVLLQWGPRRALAEVTEDRGCLGVGGRRLYRVCIRRRQEEGTTLESPEEDLEPAPSPAAFIAEGRPFDALNWFGGLVANAVAHALRDSPRPAGPEPKTLRVSVELAPEMAAECRTAARHEFALEVA